MDKRIVPTVEQVTVLETMATTYRASRRAEALRELDSVAEVLAELRRQLAEGHGDGRKV